MSQSHDWLDKKKKKKVIVLCNLVYYHRKAVIKVVNLFVIEEEF